MVFQKVSIPFFLFFNVFVIIDSVRAPSAALTLIIVVLYLFHLENDCRKMLVIARATLKKEHPGLTHKGCVLQLVSLGTISDITGVLEMRQSIVTKHLFGTWQVTDVSK